MAAELSFEVLLQKCRFAIDRFDTSRFRKSSIVADEYKRKGNTLLNTSLPNEAIQMYNKVSINRTFETELNHTIIEYQITH